MIGDKRTQWIDWCKGVGIFLVVLGHTLFTDITKVYIYGFHMPLFFFLSGLVCNEKKYDWKSFARSRFNSLIIPYVFFYILTWLLWLFVERDFRHLNLEWWQPLVGMLYGAQWHGLMDHNGILWFLPCLVTTEFLFFAITHINKKWLQWVSVILFACIGFLFKVNLPWCLNIAMVALLFFWLGNECRPYLLNANCKSIAVWELPIAIILMISYIVLSSIWMNRVDMSAAVYGNVGCFVVLALLGTLSLVLGFKSLVRDHAGGGYFGRNTLVIFTLHQPIKRVIILLGIKLLGFFPADNNLFYAVVTDVLVFICLIPFIFIWNRYVNPFLKKIYL